MNASTPRRLRRLNPEPTPEVLAGIGPGCFVRIAVDAGCAWVEVTQDLGETLEGRLQHHLAGEDCTWRGRAEGVVRFRRDQIVDLGCRHYCFC